VSAGFFGYGIPALISIHSVLANIIDMVLVEPKKLWWQTKYSHPINLDVAIEAPTPSADTDG
jgi:hypothetical protein